MACPSEARFPGFTQFFIAMELYEFGIDYASAYGEHETDKRGDIYGSITRQGNFKEKDRKIKRNWRKI
jgi:hypothetical protein